MMRLIPLLALLLLPARLSAYPEFQQFILTNSGTKVDCALCHANADGPEGLKEGQLGALKGEELERLATSRRAIAPGQKVHSPILNPFGNELILRLGRSALAEGRKNPAAMIDALPEDLDLDRDGIPDKTELREGTLPTDEESGRFWRLFPHRFKQNLFHIGMGVLATFFLLYGLENLLKAFKSRYRLQHRRSSPPQ
ncbi:MAG: hypothetical protein J0L75_09860 [Spirochaetes bacterium]|nr:hypothetical protein [Spirochaetota bacterium]